jgi:uncharacterized RDD family membrane protein YckC
MATPPAEGLPRADFRARYAAWSLDAACLLPPVALLSVSKLGYAMANARDALHAIASEMPRLLGEALATLQSPIDMARQLLADPAMAAAAERLQAAIGAILFTPLLLYAVLALPWSVLFEQSSWQATPGKRALGLVVADAQGRRLKAGHALLRYLACGLSWLSLNVGHALALLPPERLALHDRISDTRVLRLAASKNLPVWAKAWLLAQAVALAVAFVALFLWLRTALQAAMEQALGGF